MEPWNNLKSQSNLENKDQSQRHHAVWLQITLQSYVTGIQVQLPSAKKAKFVRQMLVEKEGGLFK